MEAQLVDITPEESNETDSMFEDYLKGFNEGLGKLMDKKQLQTKVNEAKSKETITGNKNILLLIDENVVNFENKEATRIEETMYKDEEFGEYLSNTERGTLNNENKGGQKADIKKFIANMDELNEKMDKLVENDDKRQGFASEQIENKLEVKEKERATKRRDKNENNSDETTGLINTRKLEENIKEHMNELKDNNITNIGNSPHNTLLSNLTVMEQTYTLEEYHKRFERKCKQEMKALEEINLNQMETHGVNECNADLHEDQYNSVPYEYQNFM